MRSKIATLWLIIVLGFTQAAIAGEMPDYQWVTWGPNNQIILRALTSQNTCPLINTANGKLLMESHFPKTDKFPLLMCQAVLPSNVTNADILQQPFILPKKIIDRIVIIGDTGCRLKKGVPPQACDDPKQWPFPVIAKHAAAWKPDLVIHVGDYLYRESHCPHGNTICAGSPHGDDWPAWQADFFKPAKPLLAAAPWIFLRGNHEICERAGEGWTRLLNPFTFSQCLNHSPLYSVDIGDTQLFMIDSANANDFVAPAQEVDWYANYLQQITKTSVKHIWLLTHKPFWFIYDDTEFNQALQTNFMDTLQTAWSHVLPHNIDLIISGHVHRFQVLNFDKTKPPQVIVGASGTRLDYSLRHTQLKGFTVAGATVSDGLSLNQFGYMTLERKTPGWTAQIRDPYGKVLANCVLHNQEVDCQETWRGSLKDTNPINEMTTYNPNH